MHQLNFLNVTATQVALFRKMRPKLKTEPTQTKPKWKPVSYCEDTTDQAEEDQNYFPWLGV